MPSFEATPAPIGMVEVQRFSGSADDPGFGSAVALAGDVLVIGAKVDGSPGSVNIYQKTNPARWLQEEGLDYLGNAYGPADRIAMSDFAPNETQAEFGTSVDLAVDSASTNVDGSGLVVGAPGAYMEGLTVNAGAAYFFLFNLAQSAWLQHGSAMRGGTELTNSNEQFGAAVATSNNLRVVVGAPGNNDGGVRAGRVYIFEYKEIPFGSSTQLDWVQVLPEPFLGQGEESLFGASVDINPTGDVIAIGEPGSQSFTILERDQASGNWTQTFQLPIREVGGSLGSAVKILSADFIAVGASQAQEGSGSVRLYQKFELGVWEEYGEIFYGEAGDQIGASGSLDGALGLDGPVIVVGASNGAVKRLDFVNERWFLVTETESGSAISAVAYSPDSNTILAGKSTENTVGFYEEGEGLPPTNSTGIPPTSEPGQESTTPPGTTTPGLGSAPPDVTQPPTTSPLGTTQAPTGAVPLATLEPTAVAGATVSPTLASTPLSSESGWQVTHGPLSGPQAGTGFGKSVSLGTNLFATGLPSLASGSVQTSSNVNGLWTSLDDLSEVNATQFGASVDLITGSSQTSLLVGAPEPVDALFLQPLGAAFFYELSGSAWARLGGVIQPVATPEEVNGKFGAAVAAAAGRICVGAPESNNIDDSGIRLSAGRVYTFTYDGTDWQEGADQVFGFAAYDRLGASMAMTANGAFLLVGAPGPGTANGVVSYYAWSGSAWLEILSVTGTASESLGASVAIISEDGSRIALGGPTFAGGAGVVRVYSQGSGSYTQLGSDIVGSLEDKFGTSLTGSNGRVVVGSSQGGFHVYDFDSTIGDWVEVSIAPVTSSAVTGVSTTGDATTVLVGLSSEEVLIYDLL
jgi:FG-GAP repeat